MAAEIYASAAGTIAQIWILSELFPRKQSVKKVYIVGWILLNFCIAHFVLLPNIWQSLLGMGVMLLMSCIMLEGRTEQKMLVIIACNVFMILVSKRKHNLLSPNGDNVLNITLYPYSAIKPFVRGKMHTVSAIFSAFPVF